ncbi:GyrI-like domain-containing protein [Pseudogracilibacillus auburnensis]|uniref:Putative transcriptional regulator YdeE n=1 Tax=Pseudogracilibacillus auburnensis TaxID=1494959 RepID=A0A2V3VWC1_9BACI|nr:GyrI-like domain-containing protein [Pseudogracilibacillus auburnensis]PXW80829.1 putative transcriptional regulator YdeE [Pseudogracilibacillus auburnensis]
MNNNIITKGPLLFVGFRLQCKTLEEYQMEIPKVTKKLRSRLDEIVHQVDEHFTYGIFKAEADESEDGYWVCMQVHRVQKIPIDMEVIHVPEIKYAMIHHEGLPKDIHQTYRKLHQEIERAKLKHQPTKWTLEEYDHQKEQTKHMIYVTLYDPIS